MLFHIIFIPLLRLLDTKIDQMELAVLNLHDQSIRCSTCTNSSDLHPLPSLTKPATSQRYYPPNPFSSQALPTVCLALTSPLLPPFLKDPLRIPKTFLVEKLSSLQ